MTDVVRARKRADLLSILGAAVVGAAVGAWWEAALKPYAVHLLVVGLLVHAVGMTARHRTDRRDAPLPRTWQVRYVLCWLAIAGVVALLAAVALRGGPA